MKSCRHISYLLLVSSAFCSIFSSTLGVKYDGNSASIDENILSPSYFYYQQPVYPRDCKELRSQCTNRAVNTTGVFLVQPDGCMNPFLVYCDNGVHLGGWTVIQRREVFSLSFNRNWIEYKKGFGFFSTEFWIENDNLAYLTNQAVYELRIDMMLSNGASLYIKYDSFRISDEWSQYALVSLGIYESNTSMAYANCPSKMTYGNCRCQPTCEDPLGVSCSYEDCTDNETCICTGGFLRFGDECVLPNECGCFLAEIEKVIASNSSYVNADCSKKCTCYGNQLSCNLDYECGPDASCGVIDDVRQCYCNEEYGGDGETCRVLHTDCYDVLQAGQVNDGIYKILPNGWPGAPFNVYCDMTTSGGGWTVFQRRIDGVTDFYRNWTSYKHGFGSLDQDKDFWLGNEQLYYLTIQRNYNFRVDIVTASFVSLYEEHTSFKIGAENTSYQLIEIGERVEGSSVNGMPYTKGRPFSTFDTDNDGCENHNCAESHRGGWWYTNLVYGGVSRCDNCHGSFCAHFQYSGSCHARCTIGNLNGDWNGGNGENVFWDNFANGILCNLISSEMKIRPSG